MWRFCTSKCCICALPDQKGVYGAHFHSGRCTVSVDFYLTGELKLAYLKKPYYVTLGLFQMAILLQFNDCLTLSTEEMIERTKLQDKDWPRHVSPLVDSKLLLVVSIVSVIRTTL